MILLSTCIPFRCWGGQGHRQASSYTTGHRQHFLGHPSRLMPIFVHNCLYGSRYNHNFSQAYCPWRVRSIRDRGVNTLRCHQWQWVDTPTSHFPSIHLVLMTRLANDFHQELTKALDRPFLVWRSSWFILCLQSVYYCEPHIQYFGGCSCDDWIL